MEAEMVEEEEEDEESVGPWVNKGDPVGFLNTDYEELIDELGVGQRLNKCAEMSAEEWISFC